MIYAQERACDILDEMKPLFEEHYKEIAPYHDIPLMPDYQAYLKLEEIGSLKLYTARENGELVGYCVFIVRKNSHYMTSLNGICDILYVSPKYRGVAFRLIKYCDGQLKALGVQVVAHRVKTYHDFGKVLERFGYKATDITYLKRLDK